MKPDSWFSITVQKHLCQQLLIDVILGVPQPALHTCICAVSVFLHCTWTQALSHCLESVLRSLDRLTFQWFFTGFKSGFGKDNQRVVPKTLQHFLSLCRAERWILVEVVSGLFSTRMYLYLSELVVLSVLTCLSVSAAEKHDAATTLLHHRDGIIQVAGI